MAAARRRAASAGRGAMSSTNAAVPARRKAVAAALGVAISGGPARLTIAADVGLAVGHHHHERDLPIAPRNVGEQRGGLDARGERGAAAAGLAGERALGTGQRAGRRQHHGGGGAAERDQRDRVATHVAIGEDQLHRALGLGEAVERSRAGRVDADDGERFAALLEARDAEILAADQHAARLHHTGGAAAQRLPRRGGAQRVDQGEAPAAAWCAASRAGGTATRGGLTRRAALATGRNARRTRGGARQRSEQIGGDGSLGGLGDAVRELLGFVRLALVGGWRVGRLGGLRRFVLRRRRRLVRRPRLVLASRRQLGRARRQHQRGGEFGILPGDDVAAGQRRRRLGRAHRQRGDAQRRDTEGQSGRAQRLDDIARHSDARQARARGGDIFIWHRLDRRALDIYREGKALDQRRRGALVALPFVEQHCGEARRRAAGQPVALGHDLAGVERGAEVGGGGATHAFGHRHHQHPTVGLREQARRGDGTACGEGGGEIEAAEKPALVGPRRQPTPGKFFLLPLAGEGGPAKRGSDEGRCRQGRHRPLPDVPSSDPTASGHLLPRAGEGKSATPPATRPAPARAGRAAPRRRVRADRSRGVAR